MTGLEPFFVADGDHFVGTVSTRGPWSREHQHGGPPAALCVRALEALAPKSALLTRLTFDFIRPIPIGAVAVTVDVTRAGGLSRSWFSSASRARLLRELGLARLGHELGGCVRRGDSPAQSPSGNLRASHGRASARQRLERLLPMAGFQVSTYGRFWVSTEAMQ